MRLMAALVFVSLVSLSGCSTPDGRNCYMTVSGSSDTMERAAAAMRECEREQAARRAQAMAAEAQRIAAMNATATALVPTATPIPTPTLVPTNTPTPIATATPEPVRERVIVPTVVIYVTVNAPAVESVSLFQMAEMMTPEPTQTPTPQGGAGQSSVAGDVAIVAFAAAFMAALGGLVLWAMNRRRRY